MKVENIDGEVVIHLDPIEVEALAKTLNFILDGEDPLLAEEEWDVLVTLRDGYRTPNSRRASEEKKR